ncbi:hypothetical protein [Brevundimonas lenta]|uniref:Uncharacterized protein n=1 Tax=Brevundimonas lenta TaxID=424796 RepID=A0A7W6NP66_9CAUL|nr:hypothetical protein [Brevundimonas lenta]MBB4082174.1 hypothetical protein [Brevundimonas lenta]
MIEVMLAVVVLAASGGTQELPAPVATLPPPPDAGICRPDPSSATRPVDLAWRFMETPADAHMTASNRQAAMAALLKPDARLFNGHDNIVLSSEAFLALVGVSGPGSPPQGAVVSTSGGTVMIVSMLGGGREMVTVVRTEGGCIATVATFYD